jgi:DNA-binding beta-propeller fold protein YncE
MIPRWPLPALFIVVLSTLTLILIHSGLPSTRANERHLLYVAVPGIRNYAEWGGVGVLVYDIDDRHRLLRRLQTLAVTPGEPPEAVKGICASARTGRLYVSTPKRLICIDLVTEKLLWNHEYEGGCDRMSISPDGSTIYLPNLEGDYWNVIDATTGDIVRKINTHSGSHNTIYGLDGRRVYLAGLRSRVLSVADARTHSITKSVGPFGDSIRPFTVNGRQSLCFVNVNGLLGFEVGNLEDGKRLFRIEVTGFQKGPVKRHGCPCHGIGLTPDEREVWLCDGANSMVHVFDATAMPPRQVASIKLKDQPGWVTFSLDGRYGYPSTGDVIDARTRQIVAELQDEAGHPVQSEKLMEIVFSGPKPVRTADQFGLGRNAGRAEN